MKILQVNKFFYPKGGADIAFLNTADLLSSKQHNISYFSMHHPESLPSFYSKYFVSNVDLNNNSFVARLKVIARIIYSIEAKRNIKYLLEYDMPDVVHLHNIYHQISPSILHVLKKFNIPVVMTLHDYKVVCASYSMLKNGSTCEACREGRYYQCFEKKCVKDSTIKSLLNTMEMYIHHAIMHIYDLVDIFISPSNFMKDKVKEMGFRGQITCLPNFVNLSDFKPQFNWTDNSIIYFGRLSKEKGLLTLIAAMKGLKVKLKIVGEGPIKKELKDKVRIEGIKNVVFLGFRSGEELQDEIRKSMFAVLPSQWYENSPRSIIEAFALGKTAIASRIGGVPELVKDNVTGLTFKAGNVDDLRPKIEYLLSKPHEIVKMGKNARRFAEKELNAEKHYEKLMRIYQEAINISKAKRS